MGSSNHNLFYYLYPKFGLVFLFLTLTFHVIGSEAELENKSGFGLKSLSIVQKSININHSDETIFFSLRAYSQLGLNKVIVFLTSPSGNKTIKASCVNRKKTKAGLLLGRIIIKKKSETGVWEINKITIEDSEGNQKSYNKEFLVKNKFSYFLLVTDN